MAHPAVTDFLRALDSFLEDRAVVDVDLFCGISAGAIENYLDKTVGNLELGRINRGLVSGARATIKKASASSVEKGIPAMEKSHQKPVVAYFESLLLQP